MDSASSFDYKIQMKICKLKDPSATKDWFSYEVSKIKFDTVAAANFICENYLQNGGGMEVISGDPGLKKFNEYTFGNQVFAWENVLVFKIENVSSRARLQPMYVVLPIRHKSFVTHVSIKDVPFQKGNVVYVESETMKKGDSGIKIEASLKAEKGISIKDFALKAIL